MSDKQQRKSVNYKAGLKKAIHDGDFEQMIKNIMLLGVKANTDESWRMSPRCFMELSQVLLKYKSEFGSDNEMAELLLVLDNSKSDTK
jgi:hypothetical protein